MSAVPPYLSLTANREFFATREIKLQIDAVLLDIRIPKSTGEEVMKARMPASR
jgi:hypothetical protein